MLQPCQVVEWTTKSGFRYTFLMQAKLGEFFLVVQKEIKRAEKNYLQAKKSASEVAASAAHSPSQAGDRYHSQSSADLANERLNALKRLEAEIKSGLVRYIEKDGQEFFLVKNVTLVPNVKLVSVDSPVGRDLAKNVG